MLTQEEYISHLEREREELSKKVSDLQKRVAALSLTLRPVYLEIVNNGNLYRERDYNPKSHIDHKVTLTVEEARKIISAIDPAIRYQP